MTSPQNPRIKLARQLQHSRDAREAEGLFVAEGARLVDDLLGAGLVARFACVGEHPAAQAWRKTHPDLECLQVTDTVMRGLSSETTPPGVLAIFEMPSPPAGSPEDREAPVILILDGLREPGNLGACLRVAAGADCRRVLLAPGCVDLYNPKVVRGAMGAHARVLARHAAWDEIGAACAGRPAWAAAAGGAMSYDAVDWREQIAVIVGSEAAGISQPAQALATGTLAIPLANGVESLNAAVACGVILFEAARQWRVGRQSSVR